MRSTPTGNVDGTERNGAPLAVGRVGAKWSDPETWLRRSRSSPTARSTCPTTRSSPTSRATAPASTSGPPRSSVMDAAAAKHGKTDRLEGGARGREGVQRDRLLAARRDGRHVPRVPDRDQGPAHHAGRRRHPLAQRRAAPDPRPLRVPAPGALVPGRAVAGEAPRARRHGDLPREHRGHLRRPRGRRGHARGEEAHRDAEGAVRLGHPRGLRRRHQADLGDRFEAPDPRRDQVRGREEAQVGHARAQGEHPEVHRGRVPQLGLRARRARSSPTSPSAGTTAAASPATRSS